MVKLTKLRPRCFFDIAIDDKPVGRIIFELFNDICPKTCENFKALCTGEKGVGKLTGKPLHYKNVAFHRVVKNFIIQSGDFSLGNGKGGESIYGGTFEDETFHFKHDKPFLLSMANRGKNTNGSQFFITLAPAHHLDGSHVVFGHVISGQEIVLKISEQPVDKNSRPTISIQISNCGELVPQIKLKEEKTKTKKRNRQEDSDDDSESSTSDSDSSSDSTSSDEDGDKRKKPSQEKGDDDKEKNTDHQDQNDDPEQSSSISLFNPKYNVKINPDEIPEVPKNKFLDRANVEKLRTQQKEDKSRFRRYSYGKSGRQIKGRGSIRYRTPSPDYGRSRRSETPPHWRYEQSRLKSFEQVVARHKRRNRDGQSEKSHHDGYDHHHQRRSRSREKQTSHRHREYHQRRSEKTRDYSDLYPSQPPRDDGHHSRGYHSDDYKHRKAEHRDHESENHHDNRKDKMKHHSNGNKNDDDDKKNGKHHSRDSKDDQTKTEGSHQGWSQDAISSKEKTTSKGKYKRFKEMDSPVSNERNDKKLHV